MTNRDEFDPLLTELGAATPEVGFEQRVLRGIERRRRIAEPARRPRRFPVFGLAGALAVAAMCVAVVALHRGRAGVSGARTVAGVGAQVQIPTRGAQRPDLQGSVYGQAVPSTRRARSGDARSVSRQDSGPEPAEAARLVSFPAPEAPLTQQEKLLLRVAHGHDTVEEAVLRTDALPLQEAQAREEFQHFFPPPDPPPNDVPPGGNDEQANPTPVPGTNSNNKEIKGDLK